jgi:hypothetical protein
MRELATKARSIGPTTLQATPARALDSIHLTRSTVEK